MWPWPSGRILLWMSLKAACYSVFKCYPQDDWRLHLRRRFADWLSTIMELFQICCSISWSDPVTFTPLRSWTVDAVGCINLWWLNSCLSLDKTDCETFMWTYDVAVNKCFGYDCVNLQTPFCVPEFLYVSLLICLSYLSVYLLFIHLSLLIYQSILSRSVSDYFSVCLCICLSVSLCVFVSFCLFVFKPVSSSVSFMLRFWLSLSLSSQLLNSVTLSIIFLSVCLDLLLCIYLSDRYTVSVSVCLSLSPSICNHAHLSAHFLCLFVSVLSISFFLSVLLFFSISLAVMYYAVLRCL